jgi:hypothetical protein
MAMSPLTMVCGVLVMAVSDAETGIIMSTMITSRITVHVYRDVINGTPVTSIPSINQMAGIVKGFLSVHD